MGRNYVKAMSQAHAAYLAEDGSSSKDIARNARSYIALMKDHIEKENGVLFVTADSRLSEKTLNRLFEGFEKIEAERIGVGRHEEFHDLLEKLSGIYLNSKASGSGLHS
jgi:hemerythrin-like domain-containing protein